MLESEYALCEQLISLFKKTFYAEYKTCLVRGGDEPIYLPASKTGNDNQIVFARGFFSSGLHEIAHWCVAGKKRRLLEDFGYWYVPDGRNETQQRAFEKVEVYPQAYEQCFTLATGRNFNISADNLNGQPGATHNFELNVHLRTLQLLFADQLDGRAKQFFEALCGAWKNPFSSWQTAAHKKLLNRIQFLEASLKKVSQAELKHSENLE